MNHINLTDTALEVKDKLSQRTLYRTLIVSGTASAEYPLFNHDNEVSSGVLSVWLLDDSMEMFASNFGTGGFITVKVLEFPE